MSGGPPIPNVLSIAGSDPGGCAGIQADLKTFAALGCHGMAALTALTAQNTLGVSAVHMVPPDFVGEQIAMIFADIEVAAVKIGMLGSPEIVEAVAAVLASHPGVPIVLDPVLVATSGAVLGSDAVIAAMRQHLFPLAILVTPNLAEAARLGDITVTPSRAAMESVAATLRAGGAAAWLIKGGHGATDRSDDVLFDGEAFTWFSAKRIDTRNTHGTGCTLSSAIAAYLAKGLPLVEAVREAKAYLTAALAGADALNVGTGPGPVDHFFACRTS
ncbi:bifunctional hydroxymethylpyrimidine kinase/phosphomethylpyrimidine kinase [Beijerinckia sp. L45]|uniref:bifunctional hydroxymethylpyrimidine kinase/phosphomethylpyrimidine kinase n=1 Tax=Beijerinckia sp. L45 TaxID=1641855 RepID=UPI001FEFBFFE|nr:bifunctional hydroxymethylpyrimidine kinase/phosphomethylpyrimidine kinase [Beijerinckia sp. L45]